MPDRSCHGSPNCAALSPSSARCCAAWAAVGLCALWQSRDRFGGYRPRRYHDSVGRDVLVVQVGARAVVV